MTIIQEPYNKPEHFCSFLSEKLTEILKYNSYKELQRALKLSSGLEVSVAWLSQIKRRPTDHGAWPTVQKAFALLKLIEEWEKGDALLATDYVEDYVPTPEFPDNPPLVVLQGAPKDPWGNVGGRVRELNRDPRITDPNKKRGPRAKKRRLDSINRSRTAMAYLERNLKPHLLPDS